MSSRIAAILLCAGAVIVPARSACDHNGCQQAVLAHSPSPAIQDCSAFLGCVVTPPTATPTITATPGRNKRQAGNGEWSTTCGTSTPGYANACPNSAAYSSACSCIGVSQWTSTAPTPTATGMTTTTAASNPLGTCLSPQPTFYLQASGPKAFNGMYAADTLDKTDSNITAFDIYVPTYDIRFGPQSSGTLFTIDALGLLTDVTNGNIVGALVVEGALADGTAGLVFRNSDSHDVDWSETPMCSIANIASAQPTLACVGQMGETVFQVCANLPASRFVPSYGDGVALGPQLSKGKARCQALTLNVLCVG